MSVIFLLLTVSTLVATVFLAGFIWAVRKGQYDDDRSPAVRILLDDAVRDGDRVSEGHAHSPSDIDQSSHHAATSSHSTIPTSHHPAQPVAP